VSGFKIIRNGGSVAWDWGLCLAPARCGFEPQHCERYVHLEKRIKTTHEGVRVCSHEYALNKIA
jgi:hypothetical protein